MASLKDLAYPLSPGAFLCDPFRGWGPLGCKSIREMLSLHFSHSVCAKEDILDGEKITLYFPRARLRTLSHDIDDTREQKKSSDPSQVPERPLRWPRKEVALFFR